MPKPLSRPPSIFVEEDCNAAPQPVENPTQIPLGESIQGQTLWCDTPTNLGTYDQSRRLHEALDFPPQPMLLPLESWPCRMSPFAVGAVGAVGVGGPAGGSENSAGVSPVSTGQPCGDPCPWIFSQCHFQHFQCLCSLQRGLEWQRSKVPPHGGMPICGRGGRGPVVPDFSTFSFGPLRELPGGQVRPQKVQVLPLQSAAEPVRPKGRR